MSTMIQDRPVVKVTTLEIKNATYEVEAIDPGFAGVAAVEVKKLCSGESYSVVLGHDGIATCECPDFLTRHDGHGTHCKHIKGVVAAGLLAAPISVEVKPTVAPITQADLKRAAMWKLRLPAGVPVEAPAPADHLRGITKMASAPAPAPVVVEDAPIVEPSQNPRDSWPAWTDEDRWTAVEEPASDLDLTSFAVQPTVEPVVSTVDPEGRTIEASLDHNGELTVAWTKHAPEAPVTPAPHVKKPTGPTVLEEAEAIGFDLGYSGENPIGPREWSALRLSAFYRGVADGQARLHQEALEDMAELDSMREAAFADPMDGIHPCELIEAFGSTGPVDGRQI